MDLRQPHPHTPQTTIVVKKSQSWEVSKWGKLYVIIMFLEALALVSLCIVSLWYAYEHRDTDPDAPGVAGVSIVALVSNCGLLYLTMDAVRMEAPFQFLMALILHAMMACYIVWHWLSDDLGEVYNRVSLGVMIFVCTCQAIYCALAYPVHNAFGWRAYKKLGGSISMRPLHRTAQIFFALLKLDAILSVILWISALFFLLHDAVEITLNVLAGMVTIIWVILGMLMVKKEDMKLARVFFVLSIVEPAFIIYKLVRLHMEGDGWGSEGVGSSHDDDHHDNDLPAFSFERLLVIGLVTLSIRAGAIILAIMAVRNFGRGLKERLWGKGKASQSGASNQAQVRRVMAGVPPGEDVDSSLSMDEHHETASVTADIAHVHTQGGYTPAPSSANPYLTPPPVAIIIEEEPQSQNHLRNYIQPLL